MDGNITAWFSSIFCTSFTYLYDCPISDKRKADNPYGLSAFSLCAKEETRTPTPEPALPPQSSVSTNFTTFAFVPKTGLEPAHP